MQRLLLASVQARVTSVILGSMMTILQEARSSSVTRSLTSPAWREAPTVERVNMMRIIQSIAHTNCGRLAFKMIRCMRCIYRVILLM